VLLEYLALSKAAPETLEKNLNLITLTPPLGERQFFYVPEKWVELAIHL